MKATGIIAEYNPLHNGHKYHIEKTRELTGPDCICIAMSGNFTQRGEIAILDKWKRAETAVRCGADIVCEIPAVFAVNNAGYFAKAGVGILEALKCEYISFGTEEGNLEKLSRFANLLRDREDEIEDLIKSEKKNGLSYPKAREKALSKLYGKELEESGMDFKKMEEIIKENHFSSDSLAKELEKYLYEYSLKLINDLAILNKPNNNLALEYLRNMTTAKPVTIKREGDYNSKELSGKYVSATAIRENLLESKNSDLLRQYIPVETAEILENQNLVSNEDLYKLILQKVLTSSVEELNSIYGAEEGLGSIMKNNVRRWNCYEDIVNDLKSKAYTRTRVRRVLISMLLNIKKQSVDNAKQYIKILAMSDTGAKYLRELKNSDGLTLPIITNINKEADKYPEICETLEFDILASDIYNSVAGNDLYLNSDFVKYPLKI